METTAKQRVNLEIKDLEEKLFKLRQFLNSIQHERLDDLSKGLLCIQLSAMQAYKSILYVRLENWKD